MLRIVAATIRNTQTLAMLILITCTVRHAAAKTPEAVPDAAPQGPLRLLHTANGLLERQLFDLAASDYRRFLAAHPRHEDADMARYGLAVCLFHMEALAPAAEALVPLSELTSFAYAAEVDTMLGRCLMDQGRHQRAAEVLSRVVGAHGEHELADDACAGAVEALHRAGQYEAAIAQSRVMLARWPESPLRDHVVFHWALADMALGHYRVAAPRFEGLATPGAELGHQARLCLAQCLVRTGDSRLAEPHLRSVLVDGPEALHAEAAVELAAVLRAQGRREEAAALLDDQLESEPRGPFRGALLMQRGGVSVETEDHERAVEAFEAAQASDSDLSNEAGYWIAKCRLRQGQFAEAAAAYKSLLRRFPDGPRAAEATFDQAIAWIRLGDIERSITALREFSLEFPDHSLAGEGRFLLLTQLHHDKRYGESRLACENFLRAHHDHARAPEARFLLAENAYLAEQHAEAEREFRAYLQHHSTGPRASAARFRLGMMAYARKQYPQALKLLSSLHLSADTRGAFQPATVALGEMHFQQGNWAEAETWFQIHTTVAEPSASKRNALLKLGIARARMGKHDDAVRAFDEVLADPSAANLHPRSLFEKGLALIQLGRRTEAIATMKRVTKAKGPDELVACAHHHLANLALEDQNTAGALDHYGQVARTTDEPDLIAEVTYQGAQVLLSSGRYADARRALDDYLARFADHGRANTARALHAVAGARLGLANDAVEEAKGLGRQGIAALPPEVRDMLRYEVAWSKRELGDRSGAMRAYQELTRDPATNRAWHARATLELAELQIDADQTDRAITLLRGLLSNAGADAAVLPEDVRTNASLRLAACEYERGQDDATITILEDLLASAPQSDLAPQAHFLCGEALLRAGRHERALAHFERVTEQYPEHHTAEPCLLRTGECLGALQRWSASETVLQTYLRRYPDAAHWFEAQFGVGWAMENQGRPADAIPAYRGVVERHDGPAAARAQFQIGECLFAQQQYEEAVRALLKVDILYAYPEWSAAALYEAGRCFLELGKKTEARAQFKAVVARYPTSRWASPASEKLAAAMVVSLPGRQTTGAPGGE